MLIPALNYNLHIFFKEPYCHCEPPGTEDPARCQGLSHSAFQAPTLHRAALQGESQSFGTLQNCSTSCSEGLDTYHWWGRPKSQSPLHPEDTASLPNKAGAIRRSAQRGRTDRHGVDKPLVPGEFNPWVVGCMEGK